MSIGFCWLTIIVISLTFFVGLYTLSQVFPLGAMAVAGMVIYALIAIAHDAAEL